MSKSGRTYSGGDLPGPPTNRVEGMEEPYHGDGLLSHSGTSASSTSVARCSAYGPALFAEGPSFDSPHRGHGRLSTR